MIRTACAAVLLIVAGCHTGRDVCELDGEPMVLPAALGESSGLALSRSHDRVLWTHNDSDGGAYLFAIDTRARLLATITLASARNRDWEDIAVAECPRGGPEADCIYVADIGDNRARRDDVGVWILPEPDPRDQTLHDQFFLRLRYPDGPRDAEAIAILPDHRLLVVTKGRDYPIDVLRSAPLDWPSVVDGHAADVPLEAIQRISDDRVDLPQQVTGASLEPRGRHLALRSYAALQFFRVDEDGLHPLLEVPVALDPLAEPQGEGVAIGARGALYLSSEAGPQGIAPRLTRLRCRVP